MTAIGVGIIGCGKAAQALHLPSLAQRPEAFRVVSICDASAAVAKTVAARHAVEHWTTDADALLARPDVEAVLVANPNRFHAATAMAALRAGKHVLIEKPAAMSLAELDALIEARRQAGCVAQVGYMRRFASGYRRALQRKVEIGEIRAVRVFDVIDAGLGLLTAANAVARDPEDGPEQLNLKQDESEILLQALGPVPVAVQNAYQLLLRLGCHDLSTLRGLVGGPRGVASALTRWNGAWLSTALDYGDFVCQLEVGLNIVAGADIRTEVIGAQGTMRLRYELPYVRHRPARLEITRVGADGELVRETHESQGQDQFVLQWDDFHANITYARTPGNSLQDAREDLLIACQIIEALKARGDGHDD